MQLHRIHRLGLLAASMAVGCGTETSVAPLDGSIDATKVASIVAEGFARAMLDEDVRLGIRDAMRSSRVVEHKLLLGEFLMTPAGQQLVERAAEAQNVRTDSMLALIGALPPMDFYAPRRTDRMTWRGEANIAVGATLDNESIPAYVFSALGGRESGVGSPTQVLFLLEPAEAKDLRIDPQPDDRGEVIQDAHDGEQGGAYLQFDARGRLLSEIQHAVLFGRRRSSLGSVVMMDCEEAVDWCDDGTQPPPDEGSPPSDTTFVDHFNARSFIDGVGTGGPGSGGTMEIEFRSTFYDESGALAGMKTLRVTGVSGWVEYEWHYPLIYKRPTNLTSEKIHVRLVETDWLSDDDMGSLDYFWSDNGVIRQHTAGSNSADVKLGWTPKVKNPY